MIESPEFRLDFGRPLGEVGVAERVGGVERVHGRDRVPSERGEASDLRGRLYVQGLAPVGNTPAEMAKEMKAESALWAKVVRERKIEVK